MKSSLPVLNDGDCAINTVNYHGTSSISATGLMCEQWDSMGNYNDKEMYPEKTVSEAHNYCRDIGNKGGPWCNTVNREEYWKHCDIPLCPLTGKSINMYSKSLNESFSFSLSEGF